MKAPIRFQSRLLNRRSYKPPRLARLRISFRPVRAVSIPVRFARGGFEQQVNQSNYERKDSNETSEGAQTEEPTGRRNRPVEGPAGEAERSLDQAEIRL